MSDLSYSFDLKTEHATFTAHTPAGQEFLDDYRLNNGCWVRRLRTEMGTGYIQIAEGRGLTVISDK